MGYISNFSRAGTNASGLQTPVKAGSSQVLRQGAAVPAQPSTPSGNSGHLRNALKDVLNGKRGQLNDQIDQVSLFNFLTVSRTYGTTQYFQNSQIEC